MRVSTLRVKTLIIFFQALFFIFICYYLFNIYCPDGKCGKKNSPRVIYPSNYFYPCIAVLIDFRTVDRIITIVHNVNQHIPSTWPIQIFHGKENEDFIKNSTLAPLIASRKIFLTLMDQVYGYARTNELLTDPKFWLRVRGEKVLLFQIDSVMCSNSPHKITDYLQYDYIGAPWDPSWYGPSKDLVGNGGFSLRSRSKMLAVLALVPYDKSTQEDVWYSLNLRFVNGSIAPVNVAKTFSVETLYYERPLAVHRLPVNCSILTKLFKTCPESRIIATNTCK
ncbi:unnamed protein product [Rotaria sp. Silwood2]|nr:unnamed protein product [Rotaria sp. Silwood2]CAF4321026.1 unnamed protein product [Rotaria sp. Silwood2]